MAQFSPTPDPVASAPVSDLVSREQVQPDPVQPDPVLADPAVDRPFIRTSPGVLDPGRLSRRQFLARSMAAGVGAATASLTWDALLARQAAATPAALPQVSEFLPGELVRELLRLALSGGGEFAEVYGEYTINTAIQIDESKVKSLQYGILSGVGIRVVDGAQVGYAYADSYEPEDLREAARVAAAIARNAGKGEPKAFAASEARPPFQLRSPAPVTLAEEAKLALVRRVDTAARGVDPRIKQVQAGYADTARRFLVANSDGLWAEDEQYVTRMTVNVLALDGSNRQSGIGRLGGQVEADYFEAHPPEDMATSAARVAIAKLAARDVKGGSYAVVIGPGWGGVLVHECFGHSLEGDGIRRQTSLRHAQLNTKVCAEIVDIYDDGTVPNSRGSFKVDDEGTPAQKNHVVEKGMLRGYLWDYLNGKLTGHRSTGNGRRSSYRDYPIPRMTNTYIAAGQSDPADIIKSVKFGIFCKDMGGGSVSPADGNFSFAVTEAYQIEDGRITHPLKNTTITGNAADAMLRIEMLGTDLAIDTTTGSCGKEGQFKPVGVGQPTVKFSEITVGGTA